LHAPTANPTGDNNYKLFQTVLYYACSKPGAVNNNAAFQNTWSLFSNTNANPPIPANVCAWNPASNAYDRKLYYYKSGQPKPATVVSTTTLLAATDGNGECYAFGQLFQDALWANGIGSTGINVTATDKAYFLVQTFISVAGQGSAPAFAPYSLKMVFPVAPLEPVMDFLLVRVSGRGLKAGDGDIERFHHSLSERRQR
jgi:hypothetical protein